MNVLFVTKGYPSAENPMKGNYEAVQAHAIAAMGHQVSVISFRWKSLLHIFDKRPLVHRTSENVDVFEMVGILSRLPLIPKCIKNYRLDRWMMQMAAKQFAKKYLKNQSAPDIIHIHSQFVAKYAIVLGKEFNVPIVLTEHWSGLNTGKVSNNILSERKIYLSSDAVIVVSHALQNALKKYYGIGSLVIYNMVENRFFKDKRKIKNDSSFTFVSVGRLVPIKCFDILVKAFSLMEHNSRVELRLIGEGPERIKIEKLVAVLHLEDKVKLLGFKTPEEVSKILCDSDCLVLSSHRETFGIVLIEAMAKGLPVVSTRCGGPEDIINESNGLLVQPDDSEDLAKAMDYMVEHAHEYDGARIRQFCYDNFSQEKISKQIIRVYESVQNKRDNSSINVYQ